MRKALLLTAVALLLTLPAFAQNTDIESLSGLNFNFGNPGARSLGMGGAFLGLADDASAAEANPAGLTKLRKPEISIEARHNEATQSFAFEGETPDFEYRDFSSHSRTAETSFASFVYPKGRFAFAAYYHLPLQFENDANLVFTTDPNTGGIRLLQTIFFIGPNGPVDRQTCINLGNQCSGFQIFPFFTAVNVRMETIGLAGAMKLGEKVSIGVAGKYQNFEETALTFRTDFNAQPLAVVAQAGDDDDITWTAGIKIEASSKFSIGAVYKQGAEFDAPVFNGTFDADRNVNLQLFRPAKFHVPDVAGVGVSFKPTGEITINADAVWVEYSNLVDDFQSVFNNTEYEAEDVTEYHIGGEYFFTTTRYPFAIRAGYWMDPEHQTKFVGPLTGQNAINANAAAILYPGGEDQSHYSLGLGVVLGRLQLDAAYDTSDNYKVGSISGVVRF